MKYSHYYSLGIILLTCVNSFGSVHHSSLQEGPQRAFWTTGIVKPSETALLPAGGFGTAATVYAGRLDDGPPGLPGDKYLDDPYLVAIPSLQTSTASIKFVLPSSWLHGVFAYRIKSGETRSPRYLLNGPEVWYVQGDLGRQASPGGTLRVVGTALALPGASGVYAPSIALVDSLGNARIIPASLGWNVNADTSAYAQTFSIPANVLPGNYTLYYHNGLGGPSAWSQFTGFDSPPNPANQIGGPALPQTVMTVTIANPPSWPSNVVLLGAPGTGTSDDALFTAAFAQLKSSAGGILSIPAGIYSLTKQWVVPNRVILKGAGKTSTILKWIVSPLDPQGNRLPLIVGANAGIQGYWGEGVFSMEALAIVGNSDFIGTGVYFRYNWSSEPRHLREVSITLPMGLNKTTTTIAIELVQTENVEITQTDTVATQSIHSLTSNYVYVQGCKLHSSAVDIFLNGSSNFFVADNTLTAHGFYPFDGGDYGIVVTSTSFNASQHHYLGGNIQDSDGTANGQLGGMTFDELSGAFFGAGVTVQNSTLTLPNPVSSSTPLPGMAAMILSGTGAGQWRNTTPLQPTPNNSVTVDRPWDILPDKTSVFSLVQNLGRIIFAGNIFSRPSSWNVAYYFAHDVIVANNTWLQGGPTMWGGLHYNGVGPGWNYQVTGNRMESSVDGDGMMGSASQTVNSSTINNSWYTDIVTRYQLYRDNIYTNGAFGQINMSFNSNLGDVLLENNRLPSILFGGAPNLMSSVSSSLTRQNTLNASSGSLIITSPAGVTHVPANAPAGPTTISGRVADANGEGIAGVTLVSNNGDLVVTDANGTWSMNLPLAYSYIIMPSKIGMIFAPVAQTVTVPAGAPTPQNFVGQWNL